MTAASNAIPMVVATLVGLAIILSIVVIRKNRRAKLLNDEIQAVSAERNDLDQKVRGLLRKPRSTGHQTQHTIYQTRLWPKPYHNQPSRRPVPRFRGEHLSLVQAKPKPSRKMEHLRILCARDGRHPFAVKKVHIATKPDPKYGFQYIYACPIDNHREAWIIGYDGKPFRLWSGYPDRR